jgi:hypothetical protein
LYIKMSYLERLQGLKSSLDSVNQQYQEEQDNFTRDAENMRQMAVAKIEDYARNLEQAGGVGFGAIKAGQSAKKLYNKWKNKNTDKDGNEKQEDGKTGETQEEEDGPSVEDTTQEPGLRERMANDLDDMGENDLAESIRGGSVNKDVIEEAYQKLKNGNYDQQATADEVKATKQESDAKRTGEQEEPSGNEETSRETGPEEPELTGEGEEIADTTNLPSQVELNDASNFGSREGTTALSQDNEAMRMTTPEAQQATLDADPEGNMNVSDATTNLGGSSGADVSTSIGEGVGDGVSTAVDAGSAATSSLLDTGLAIGDAVLDAIPVVGEIAMIGTAIAGFFEGIFGGDSVPKVNPAPAIVAKVGQDASAIIQKAPGAVSGLV